MSVMVHNERVHYKDLSRRLKNDRNNIYLEFEGNDIHNLKITLLKVIGCAITDKSEIISENERSERSEENISVAKLLNLEKRKPYRTLFLRNIRSQMHLKGIDTDAFHKVFNDVSVQSIYNVLNGNYSFSVEDVFVLKAMGFKIDKLFTDVNTEEITNLGYDSNLLKEINELMSVIDINSIKKLLIDVTDVLKISKKAEVSIKLFESLKSTLTTEQQIEELIELLNKMKQNAVDSKDLLNMIQFAEKFAVKLVKTKKL